MKAMRLGAHLLFQCSSSFFDSFFRGLGFTPEEDEDMAGGGGSVKLPMFLSELTWPRKIFRLVAIGLIL